MDLAPEPGFTFPTIIGHHNETGKDPSVRRELTISPPHPSTEMRRFQLPPSILLRRSLFQGKCKLSPIFSNDRPLVLLRFSGPRTPIMHAPGNLARTPQGTRCELPGAGRCEGHSPGVPSSLVPSSPSHRCPCPVSPRTRSGAAGCVCDGAASQPASSSGVWAT